jgi:hypothetical protein
MNLEEFRKTYISFKIRDRIVVACDKQSCDNKEQVNKDSAIRNIQQNGIFLCRSCCYTPEGRAKIAKATSYKRSEITKKKMSDAKLEFYGTPAGDALKKKLSKLTAAGHGENKFEKTKRKGLFPSSRTGKLMAYESSYELRLCWLLDQKSWDDVVTYQTQVYYEIDGRGRSLDFLIEFKNKTIRAIEVKPKKRLDEQASIAQISDSSRNAEKNSWLFEVWTEEDFDMTYKELRVWADEYRSKLDNIDYVAHRKALDVDKSRRHYQNKRSSMITFCCGFCQEEHTVRQEQYDANVEKNGRYICIKENGHLIGQRSKDYLKKENPYAAEGKKKCFGSCGQVLDLNAFGNDKSRADGKANRCKECRAGKAKETYNG